VRDVFFGWLREQRPELVERYEALYRSGAYLPADERRTIERAARAPWARAGSGQRFKQRAAAERRRIDAARRAGGGGERPPRLVEAAPRIPPAQQSLF
jgi:hypothetical protein